MEQLNRQLAMEVKEYKTALAQSQQTRESLTQDLAKKESHIQSLTQALAEKELQITPHSTRMTKLQAALDMEREQREEAEIQLQFDELQEKKEKLEGMYTCVTAYRQWLYICAFV